VAVDNAGRDRIRERSGILFLVGTQGFRLPDEGARRSPSRMKDVSGSSSAMDACRFLRGPVPMLLRFDFVLALFSVVFGVPCREDMGVERGEVQAGVESRDACWMATTAGSGAGVILGRIDSSALGTPSLSSSSSSSTMASSTCRANHALSGEGAQTEPRTGVVAPIQLITSESKQQGRMPAVQGSTPVTTPLLIIPT
jgi:hypothetical protein